MAVPMVIALVTVALAAKAGVWSRRRSHADSEDLYDAGLLDMCTRSFTLVLMALMGLLAIGVTYGNVLGAGLP